MKLLVVADLDFGLGGAFFMHRAKYIFFVLLLRQKSSPFLHAVHPLWTLVYSPLCETQSIWNEAFASLNIHNHSFIAVKRSFPVPASLFFAVDLSF